MTLIDDPERLRSRAAEMRSRAEKAVLPETRNGLLRIAEDFDGLAARAEQRLASLRKVSEPHDTGADDAAAPGENHPPSSEAGEG